MDFELDEEQQALREAVRGLLGKRYGDFETRRATVADAPAFDRGTWSRMAEMGLLGLPFAEEDGGVGAGPIEVAVVAEEIGRLIAPEPFLTGVVLAGGLVAAAGTPEQRS
ncbi:MAG TPA: acyl-CoA dehydrogenase family protein, partial [Nocardioides sp.]